MTARRARPSRGACGWARSRTTTGPVALLMVAALATACSGGSSSGGATSTASTSSSGITSTASGTSSPAASTSLSPSPLSTADREAADRVAVEQAWSTYWQIHQGLLAKPSTEWPATVATVAVDPTRQQVLDEARTFASSGMGFYGQVVNHPYWNRPIDGQGLAVMGDCMDTSRYGTLVVKTGVKRTVGRAKDNTRATFVKGDDGTWRVQKIEFLVDTPC